jgi:hypothetical protein
MKISKLNAEHYIWGDQCDGWHLVSTSDLSIIQERMPAKTSWLDTIINFHVSFSLFCLVLRQWKLMVVAFSLIPWKELRFRLLFRTKFLMKRNMI